MDIFYFTLGMFIQERFKNVPYEQAKQVLRKRYCVSIKWKDNLMCVKYGSKPSIWFKKGVPDIVQVLSENRGAVYEKYVNNGYKLVSLPFTKFWNYNHKLAHKVVWNENTKIYEKVDGYLMKAFYYSGKWYISTCSDVDARDVPMKSKLVRPNKESVIEKKEDRSMHDIFMECVESTVGKITEQEFFQRLDKTCTFMFEMIHPDMRILIPYKNPYIYHIGTRNMETLNEIELDIGLPKPKCYTIDSMQDVIDKVEKMHWTIGEGFVVQDEHYNRVKVKSPSYSNEHTLLELHKGNRNGLIDKYIRYVILSNEVEECIKWHPELKKKIDEVNKDIQNMFETVEQLYNKMEPYYEQKRVFFQMMGKEKVSKKCKKIVQNMLKKQVKPRFDDFVYYYFSDK